MLYFVITGVSVRFEILAQNEMSKSHKKLIKNVYGKK